MKFCDGKCGRVVTPYGSQTYSLRVNKFHNRSRVYTFCSAGCTQDFVDLEKQGLVEVEWKE